MFIVTRCEKTPYAHDGFRFWLADGGFVSPSTVLRPITNLNGQYRFAYNAYGEMTIEYQITRAAYDQYKKLGGKYVPERSDIII